MLARILPLAALAGLCGGTTAPAQFTLPEARCARSVSGQFIVRGVQATSPTGLGARLSNNRDFIHLDPAFLTVSCERIKTLLFKELAAPPAWQGKIYVALEANDESDRQILVTSAQFSDGWQYQLALPEFVKRGPFVRGLVQVLLLELANRTADSRSAEIPIWLFEGLAQQLMASDEIAIILPLPPPVANGPSFQASVINARRADPLAPAREQLRKQPVTFDELSWPSENFLMGEAGEGYSRSAQAFVNELLLMPDGRACLRAMLADLPHRQNWQFAFLAAFSGYFQQPLDVEKWWALHQAHFTGRESAQAWSLPESCQKLDQALHTPVQFRTGTNALPSHSSVSLQTIIREWDRAAQVSILKAKTHELQSLQLRMTPALSPMVADYIQALTVYLGSGSNLAALIPVGKASRHAHAADQVLSKLDTLDALRRDFQPFPPPIVSADGAVSQRTGKP